MVRPKSSLIFVLILMALSLLFLAGTISWPKTVQAAKNNKGITSLDDIGNKIGSLDSGRGTSGTRQGNVITGPGTDSILTGTSEDDVIFAGSGNVIVYGIGGNDIIYGGVVGEDKLYGQTGDDVLVAGAGNNLLDGGPGDDVILGTTAVSGNDLMVGGSGNDKLVAGSSDNVMKGGSGADLFDCGTSPTARAVILDYNPANGDMLAGNCKVVNPASNTNAGSSNLPSTSPNK
jgi:Ca2+-binding RTX toxin-like protein